MFIALVVIVLALGALSTLAALWATSASGNADQVRGFCLVGAFGCAVVAVGVIGIGLAWDGRVADAVAIIALFALVAFYLAALAIGYRPNQPRRRRRKAITAATTQAVPAPTRPKRIAFRPDR